MRASLCCQCSLRRRVSVQILPYYSPAVRLSVSLACAQLRDIARNRHSGEGSKDRDDTQFGPWRAAREQNRERRSNHAHSHRDLCEGTRIPCTCCLDESCAERDRYKVDRSCRIERTPWRSFRAGYTLSRKRKSTSLLFRAVPSLHLSLSLSAAIPFRVRV